MNASLKVWLQLAGLLLAIFLVGFGVMWVSNRGRPHPVTGSAPAAAGRRAAG
jgi:hypothetical protein